MNSTSRWVRYNQESIKRVLNEQEKETECNRVNISGIVMKIGK